MSDKDSVGPNKLLVMLIDGFRWDYFDKPGLDLPGFNQLFKEGVKSEYLEPVFPTLSYPNYYSLMTGLYCEDHGMIGNYMYDEKRNEYFNMMSNPESKNSHWWEGAEPFWITAVKQKRRTYMMEWSGGEFPHKGVSSTYSIPVDLDRWPTLLDIERNIKKAVDLFKRDEIDMAGVYLAEIDECGHCLKQNSKELGDKIQEFDRILKSLLDELNVQSLRDKVNIVIFSDHGMAEIAESRAIDISKFLNTTDVKVYTDRGNMCNIWPCDGKLEKVYGSLKGMNNNNVQIYKKTEIPECWRYKNHRLVPPITVMADSGWFITTPEYPSVPCCGFHGYCNSDPDMRGIFLASGPDIKQNGKIGAVSAVDVYQVLCKLLQIQPLSHSGVWSNVKDMFL